MNKALVEAVELSIVIWKELTRLGCNRRDLPPEILEKVEDCMFLNPLCQYMLDKHDVIQMDFSFCAECPLETCATNYSLHGYWHEMMIISSYKYVSTDDLRVAEKRTKKAAQKIVNKLEKWLKENK